MENTYFNVVVTTRVRGADGNMNMIKQSYKISTAKTEHEAEEMVRQQLTALGFRFESVNATRMKRTETRRTRNLGRKNNNQGSGFFGFGKEGKR